MQNADKILWTSGFFNERFPAPISPLGWSLIGPLIEELALRDPLRFLGYPDAEKITLTRLWRGHPYANALAFHMFYKCFPDFILPEDAYRYFPNGDVKLRKRAPYPRWIDLPHLGFSLLRTFFSDPFNVSPLNNYRHWAHYTREHDRRVAAIRARLNHLANAEPQAIFAALREVDDIHRELLRIHRWSLMDADLTFGLLKRLVGSNDAACLVAGVPNKTMEVDAALRAITNRQLPITEFLAEHGHRSFSLDIAVPTFAEEPEQITRLLKNTEDGKRKTKDASSSFIFHPSSFSKRALVPWIVVLTRKYVAMREDQRYYWQKALALSRHLYLLLADRLVADKMMADRNFVFYATQEELVNYFERRLPKDELAYSIAARQSEWQVYQREFEQSPTESYPAFLTADSSVTQEKSTSQVATPTQHWHGRAVSPGIARGVARIVQSPNELSRIQQGEILVAPSTDPAWTPVFARIGGLVVERGGVLSHSAVVAREYHIPAVAGIANVVAQIKDGDVIEVDGSRGVVSAIVR